MPGPPEPCTGIAASWCPRHGSCTCPDVVAGVDYPKRDGPTCPLHGLASDHPLPGYRR